MDNYLNLSQAADLFAELTNNARIKDDCVRIIMLGAEGKIPIYWRNPLVWTRISSSFDLRPKEELEPLPNSDTAQSWLQMKAMELSAIEFEQQIQCWIFEIDAEDCLFLIRNGESIFTDTGLCKWFRHTHDYETVTVSRDQLFVFDHDLRRYAAELTSTAKPAKAAAIDQEQTQATPSASGVTRHSTKEKELDHIGQHLKNIVANMAHPTADTVMVEFKELALAGVSPFTGGISADNVNKKWPKGSLLYVKGTDVLGLKKRNVRERLNRLNDKK